MAGRPWNALTTTEHWQRGTYRADRHAAKATAAAAPLSAATRRRVLTGLAPEGRRIAADLLDAYGDWDESALFTLRLYVESCVRLAAITDDTERRREQRANLALLKALRLEPR